MTGTRAATTGCTTSSDGPIKGTIRVTASLEGKDPVMASATLAVEIILHEIAPKVEEKEVSGHWKSRHW